MKTVTFSFLWIVVLGICPLIQHGSLKTGKVLEFAKKTLSLEKHLIFSRNINKPGKVCDFNQPEMFCCWTWKNVTQWRQLLIKQLNERKSYTWITMWFFIPSGLNFFCNPQLPCTKKILENMEKSLKGPWKDFKFYIWKTVRTMDTSRLLWLQHWKQLENPCRSLSPASQHSLQILHSHATEQDITGDYKQTSRGKYHMHLEIFKVITLFKHPVFVFVFSPWYMYYKSQGEWKCPGFMKYLFWWNIPFSLHLFVF